MKILMRIFFKLNRAPGWYPSAIKWVSATLSVRRMMFGEWVARRGFLSSILLNDEMIFF